ncbi:MAG: hypothetical protein IPG92_15485 [Flavobacteriales bacterium]|nr:hypothetical protein [Flavobacteriales bacterium]
MPPSPLPDYLRLNRANGRAPHKPILLLAVLKAFDEVDKAGTVLTQRPN